MSDVPEALRDALLASRIRVFGQLSILEIIPGVDAVDGVAGRDCLYVVTTWNPGGEHELPQLNDLTLEPLVVRLDAEGVEWSRAGVVAEGGGWAYAGVAVLGPTRFDARRLGRDSGQAIVLEFDPAGVVLSIVSCSGDQVVSRRAATEQLAHSPGPMVPLGSGVPSPAGGPGDRGLGCRER